ncbi:MAG: ABC transporter permease [Pirellulales bacterium]
MSPMRPKAFPLGWLARSEAGLGLAVVAVVLLTLLFDQQRTYYYSPELSALDVLRHTSMLGIFALGAAIVIISGGIDLSAGSVIAFSGTICATLMVFLAPEAMQKAEPLGAGVTILAVGGTLVVGFLIGSLHAWLITVIGLPPFIATLATLVGLRSLARAVIENVTLHTFGARTTQIQIFDQQFRSLTTSVWLRAALFLTLAVAAWVLLSRTVVGRHLYALGGNEEATRLSGIRTDRLKWLAYALSAMLSSIAGIFYIGEQSVADPQTLARGYELNAIAAAVVGGCSLRGGIGTIPGTVLGCLFLRVVIDGIAKIIKTGADVYEGLIVGIVVVMAVALNQLRETSGRRKRFFEGPLGAVTVINLALLLGVLTTLVASPTSGQVAVLVGLACLALVKLFEAARARRAGS